MRILFASHNPNKVKEVQAMLGAGFELVSLTDIGLHEDIPETGSTLEENAKIKAEHVFAKTKLPVFADDTGLEVEALSGAPGVYSARYAGSEKSDAKNMAKLLRELEGKPNRKAQFRTVFHFINSEGEAKVIEGKVEGEILNSIRGEKGFGYDPIFLPEGKNQSFAEMSREAKNEISHRGRALRKLVEYLRSSQGA